MANQLPNEPLIRGIYGQNLGGSPGTLKKDLLVDLRVKDETEFVRRFKWINLPAGITGDLIERILYYKGRLMAFYSPELDQFYFLPFTMQGDFDVYGRYTTVAPTPFTGQSDIKPEDNPREAKIAAVLSQFVRKPVYTPKMLEELTIDDITESCVILNDYTQQLSQNIQPREKLQEPILRTMAEMIPFMRTRMINDTGIKFMRVPTTDDQKNVTIASRNIVGAALEGDAFVPTTGKVDFQDFPGASSGDAEEFLMAYQSLDNIRKANLGIASSGAFEKSAHTLQSEQAMNASSIDLVLQDAILQRQLFCTIFNSIFPGLGIWVEPAEQLVMADINGDGVDYDRQTPEDEQETSGGESDE